MTRALLSVHDKTGLVDLGRDLAMMSGGLPSRVDSAWLVVDKAGERAKGAVMASDAFFAFPNEAQVGIDAGATAIVAPGGSIRDDQVIAAANAANVAMVFTGIRQLWH